MEISGQFKAHDAFVNMCFGHMADIEDFEAELAEEFAEREDEVEEARSLLKLLVAQKSKSGVTEAWTDFYKVERWCLRTTFLRAYQAGARSQE